MTRLLIALVLLGTVWISSPVHAATIANTDAPAQNPLAQNAPAAPAPVQIAAVKSDMISVPTLAAALDPGTVISENDLVWTDVPAVMAKRRIVVDPSEVVGMAIRRQLPPGEAIALADVRKPILIARGALVTMRVSMDGIELTTIGKAMDQGTMGDMVRILNPSSNRIVPAVVAGPNMAMVAASP